VDSSRPLPDLVPWYRKYSGEIRRVSANHFKSFGHAKIVNPYVVEIDELPIGTWIANYKSQLETWVTEEKIVEFKENHIDDFVSFRVVFQSTQSTESLTNQPDTFYETMKLVQSVKPHLVAFRHDGSLHHYQSPEEIIREFFTIRHDMYVKRRSLLIHQAKRKLSRASNQRRFIDEVNEDVLHVRNVSKSVILEQLIARKYDPFDTESNGDNGDHAAPVGSDDSQHDSSESNMNQYRYLLNMPLWSLTKERAASLAEQVKSLEQQLQVITDTTVTMMWTQELDAFDKAYQVHLDTQCQRPLPGQKRTQSSLVQSTLKRSRVGSNDSRESKVKKQKTLNLIPTSVQQAW
jgi:DNA topoisomerase-2